MKKLLGMVFLSLLLTITIAQSKIRQELHTDDIKALQEGGKIIYLGQAYAPRTLKNTNHDKNYNEKNLLNTEIFFQRVLSNHNILINLF